MIYRRHPTDDLLVIGDNGHIYAATRLPETGWHFAIAWAILDTIKPGAIPTNVRLLLAGQIAGALEANNPQPAPTLAPSPPADDVDTCRIIAQCHLPDQLSNAWLQHLRDFDAAHPGCHFEVMMQTGRDVPVREMVEALKLDPELTIEQVFERKRQQAPPAAAGPSASAFERAAAAVRRHPGRSDRTIAREIGVSHQTVARARAAIEQENRGVVQNNGDHGPPWTKGRA